MSIHVDWGSEERRVVLYYFDRHWSWDEIGPANEEAKALLNTVNHKVDMIVDMRNSAFLPSGGTSYATEMAKRIHHNHSGRIVFVGTRSFLQAFARLLAKLQPSGNTGVKTRFVTSLEDAYVLLADTPYATRELALPETGPLSSN